MVKQSGLGKGFGSLLPSDFDESILLDKDERVQKILIQDIIADPNQPRKSFDPSAIDELASSIKTYGILQPLVVIQSDDKYIIVAGERRFRAAKKAGLENVPALVRSLEELERLELSLIENVQRVDLSPLEQAKSIARLNQQFSLTFQEIAKRLGKAHTTVVNTTRLLQLPDFAIQALETGKISEGHARSVLALKELPDRQRDLVNHIVKDGWSVRRAEQYVQDVKASTQSNKKSVSVLPDHPLAKSISTQHKAKVRIQETKKGGKIQLTFDTKDDLDSFLKRIS